MGGEFSQGEDSRPVLYLTGRIHQRQCGADIDADGIYERLRLAGRLAGVAGQGVSDGAEIVAADSAQMKKGVPRGIPLQVADEPRTDAGFGFSAWQMEFLWSQDNRCFICCPFLFFKMLKSKTGGS